MSQLKYTLKQINQMIITTEKEFQDYKASSEYNKHVENGFVMDIGNLYELRKEFIKLGHRYRCINNAYGWCHTKTGENEYIVIKLDHHQVSLNWSFEEDDNEISGTVAVNEFWNFFELIEEENSYEFMANLSKEDICRRYSSLDELIEALDSCFDLQTSGLADEITQNNYIELSEEKVLEVYRIYRKAHGDPNFQF